VEPPGPNREADPALDDVGTTARPKGHNYWMAERHARELLCSWLSPEQRRQYDARRNFEVVGSDTGKRYRICKGSVFNIQELNAEGQQVRALCFTAEGVATGDVNLAQKIALETFGDRPKQRNDLARDRTPDRTAGGGATILAAVPTGSSQ
jgi:hypothetical protein